VAEKSPVRNTRFTHVGQVTADGVALRGRFWRPETPSDLAIVVAHGFTGSVERPAFGRIAERLARQNAVVSLSFRGHGRSSGRTSVGPEEVLDLAASVQLAGELGYARVAVVGFSMGAAVSLLYAAGHPVDAVVSVSAPSRWYIRQTSAMRRLHWLIEAPHGRLLAPILGVRLGRPWPQVPVSPIEVVHRIAPTPLLLVHGDRDHYFPAEHATALYRAAGMGTRLWLEPGMGHAESGVTPGLVDRIATWLNQTCGDTSDQETSTQVVA
jgi:pimeloyl-ACP methyl ester carboxylesterase